MHADRKTQLSKSIVALPLLVELVNLLAKFKSFGPITLLVKEMCEKGFFWLISLD